MVWNIFFIFPNGWDEDPIWLSYFSEGLKPPTRIRWIMGGLLKKNGVAQTWVAEPSENDYNFWMILGSRETCGMRGKSWKIHGIPDVVPVVFDGEKKSFPTSRWTFIHVFIYILYIYIFVYLYALCIYIYDYIWFSDWNNQKKRGCHSHIQLI